MNYTEIYAKVVDQTLTITNAPLIASGGVNDIRINFDFCPLWNDAAKTAVFIHGKEDPIPVDLDLNSVIVPPEAIASSGIFSFGVIGITGDQTRPTEVVQLKIRKGPLDATITVKPPTVDIYAEFLRIVQQTREEVAKANAVLIVSCSQDIAIEGDIVDTVSASHTAGEIKEHIEGGGVAVVDYLGSHYMFSHFDDSDSAVFSGVDTTTGKLVSVVVAFDYMVTKTETDIGGSEAPAMDEIVEAVLAALPNGDEVEY